MAGGQRRGGRGGRRGGEGDGMPRNVQISKKLSWLLRHGAEKEGLSLGPGGYVNVKDVLGFRALKSLKVSLEELREVVVSDEKGRYSLIPMTDLPSTSLPESSASAATVTEAPASESSTALELDNDDPANFLIRANQGHSIKLASGGLLEPVTHASMPEMVVHGTTHKAWKLILQSGGLRRMGRNHVHFAAGLPRGFTAFEGTNKPEEKEHQEADTVEADGSMVISGMRSSSAILIYIDLSRALDNGLKFWRSENGVILSEGDDRGFVRSEFFERVEDRSSKSILFRDGKTVNESGGKS